MTLREERIATMLAMGAELTVITEEEAAAIDAEPGKEWIGTEAQSWTVDYVADMDTKDWQRTLTELENDLKTPLKLV